jgi:6-phosphogluconolactonase (cycloisomerase 2 family)
MSIKFLNYQTSPEIKAVINSLGRTEDIKFSPDGKYFAIAEYLAAKIRFFGISISGDGLSQVVEITKCTTITSSHFHEPHGITFLGNEYFVVANRTGDVTLFKCPSESSELSEVELMPLASFKGQRHFGEISSPGSVESYKISDNKYRVLVCNNYIHTVVSFVVNLGEKIRVKNNGILIRRFLAIPDGITISPNKKWVAISNHTTNEVLIYRLIPQLNWITAHFGTILNRFAKPVGKLTGLSYAHGLRFSNDGTKIFVADAGEPFLNIYQSNDGNWDKQFEPSRKIKTIDDIAFEKESGNPQEGGIKGLDLGNNNQLLATTTEHQVLSFFAVDNLLSMQ